MWKRIRQWLGVRRVTLDVIEWQEKEMRRLEEEQRRARHAVKVLRGRVRRWERAWSWACEDVERVNRERQVALAEVVAAVKAGGGISGEGLETMLRAAKVLPAETVREKGVVFDSIKDPNGEA